MSDWKGSQFEWNYAGETYIVHISTCMAAIEHEWNESNFMAKENETK